MSTAPAYVTGCRVTISGADMTPITLDVPLSTGQISGSVMPGVRRFDVVVSTDFGVTFTGSTTAVLTPGPNGISIQLAVNAPPTAKLNVSNASPKVGESVTISANATDLDAGDTHTFTWNGGGGSISGSGSSVTWVGNLPGSYTVSVTVDDGHGGVVTQSVGININNTVPVIQYVRADKTQVVVGDTINLSCSATDADGDLLAYSWSDGMGWSATGQNAAYTVKSSANPSITFTCEVNDGNHGGTAKGTVTIGANPGVPGVITYFTATGASGQVDLLWDPYGNAPYGATFNIYWSTSPGVTPSTGNKITIATPACYNGGATCVYTHTGRTDGTTYYYVITAVNSAGEGAPSAEVNATPNAVVTPPSAPTTILVAGGSNSVGMTWSPVANATSYNLYWRASPGVTTSNGTKIANVGTYNSTFNDYAYNHTGLTANTTYYYILTAVNAGGESAASPEANATTMPGGTPPSSPTGVSAVGASAQVTVSWGASAGATSYNLYWSNTSPVTTGSTKITGVTSPYVHTPLTNGVPYYYVITAVNSAGESPLSVEVNATPGAALGITTIQGHVKYGSAVFVPGVTLQLYDPSWAVVLATAVTDANGFYSITGLSYPILPPYSWPSIDLLWASIPNPPYDGTAYFWICSTVGSTATCDFHLWKSSPVTITGDHTTANMVSTTTPPVEAVTCNASIYDRVRITLFVSSPVPVVAGVAVWTLPTPVAGLVIGTTYYLDFWCYDAGGMEVSHGSNTFVY